MSSNKLTLTITDYVIFGAALFISASAGLVFQLLRKKESNEEYLLAGRDMSLLPVVISLMATFMSATTLMGIPADIYLFGTNMAFMNIGFMLGPVIAAYVFLPIYFKNDVSTLYEYLELRFGKKIRIIISTAFTFQAGLFTSATLYAPALALSAVTDLSVWLSIVLIGVVCTFYCTLGGMKAVLWTDVFQAALMYVCIVAIIAKGCADLGGLASVLNAAQEGGRLLIPRFSMDMSMQYTFFNVLLQGILITTSSYCGTQIQVQRLRTLKTLKRSKIASLLSIPLVVSFHLLCCLCGLIFYAYFRRCDPMTAPNTPIHSVDQLMPYFITSAMQEYPGLPGLCIAGIFSASLSTISSSLNSLAAVTVEDFIRPCYPNLAQKVVVTKFACFLIGVLCIAFSFVLASLGNLIRMTIIIYGLVAGPNLGVFLLAACTRRCNEKGAILGILSGLTVGAFLSFVPNRSQPPFLPVSNECPDVNTSAHTSVSVFQSTLEYKSVPTLASNNFTFEYPHEEGFEINISYMWISSISLLTCLIVGYGGSVIISCFQGDTEVPIEYISPVCSWSCNRKSKEKASTLVDSIKYITNDNQKNISSETKL